jgi:bifunctional DNA-binding transcriptional regulator/antitoxin component of YhaV-PrlF toxin-antitoxin module
MPANKSRTRTPIASARLGKDGAMTIPVIIRRKLRMRAGDHLLFESYGSGIVSIRKRERSDAAFLDALSATLSEWNSTNDNRAYRDL